MVFWAKSRFSVLADEAAEVDAGADAGAAAAAEAEEAEGEAAGADGETGRETPLLPEGLSGTTSCAVLVAPSGRDAGLHAGGCWCQCQHPLAWCVWGWVG